MIRPNFDNRFNPVGAWLFSGSSRIVDRSGNGYDLTSSGSFDECGSYVTGLSGTVFGSASLSTTEGSFRILDSMAVEIVAQGKNPTVAAHGLCTWGGSGETEATNIVYQCKASADGFSLFWEHGEGVNAGMDSVTAPPNFAGVVPADWFHVIWSRRSSSEIDIFCNGVWVYTHYATQLPTGGTSGGLYFGGSINGNFVWYGLYAAIYDQSLTLAQASYLAKLRGVISW